MDDIKRLKGKITMILIVHRLSTVQHCYRMNGLEKDKIAEEGTPCEVLRKVI